MYFGNNIRECVKHDFLTEHTKSTEHRVNSEVKTILSVTSVSSVRYFFSIFTQFHQAESHPNSSVIEKKSLDTDSLGVIVESMETITMLDLRTNSELLLKKLKKKEKVILSFRGKPIATIHPILEEAEWEEDIFGLQLKSLSKKPKGKKKTKISNSEIDTLVYGI